MTRHHVRRALVLGPLSLGVAVAMTACGASNEDSGNDNPSDSPGTGGSVSGTLNGAGSTAQEAAMAAWKAGFQTANTGATVNYDAVGSGGGREQFLAGGVNFAGSDAYLSDDELTSAQKTCGGDPVEVPVYVSPIAVIYNLDGVDKLQPVARDPRGHLRRQDHQVERPAIASENAGRHTAGHDITPVHRSDDSGTTQNFTDYLAQAAPDNWTYPASQTWPVQGGEAGDGTSGVVAAVTGGAGTIGYADESQAGDLGKAMIKVGSAYVGPSAEAASKVLDESKVGLGSPLDRHRDRHQPHHDGCRRLPDHPGLVPDHVPEAGRPGRGRPDQGFRDLRRELGGSAGSGSRGRLGAPLGLARGEGSGGDRHHHHQITSRLVGSGRGP